MPFSKLHIAGNVLLVIGSTVVYSCAVKGSWRWTLVGVAIGTLGGATLLMAPSPFLKTEPVNRDEGRGVPWTTSGD